MSFEATLRKLGIVDTMEPRLQCVQGGANAMAVLAGGETNIGVTFLSEIHNDDVEIVGVLPRDIFMPTALMGYVHAKSAVLEAARALLAYLASLGVAEIYRGLGMVAGRLIHLERPGISGARPQRRCRWSRKVPMPLAAPRALNVPAAKSGFPDCLSGIMGDALYDHAKGGTAG